MTSLKSVTTLSSWILVAMPFAGARCVYSVIYTFDHTDLELNPVIGALWAKAVLVVLAPLGAALAMCIGGFVTRKLSSEMRKRRHGNMGNVTGQSQAFMPVSRKSWEPPAMEVARESE